VQGRSRTTFEDMVRLDLQYIDGWSLWTDFSFAPDSLDSDQM